MADRIDDLVGQEAYDQVIKLDKMMGELVTRFDLVAKSALSMQVALGDTKKINEVISAQQKQAKSLDEIERLEKKLADTMTLKAQLMQEIKSKQQEEVLNNKAFIKSVQAQEGSINQLRLQLNQATKAYDAMAKAERESGKGTTLLTNIQNTTTALKALEANTGRFQRNVGNYTNSTFQLTQVMRELPNFAQSAEIGIRSLSNNLPMLADSFGQVRKEAGGTIPALKIFASTLFTFAGIFPLVLMGLISYHKEIISFVKGIMGATGVVDKFKLSNENLIKSMQSSEYTKVVENVSQLTANLELAKQGFYDKTEVVKDYNKTLGETMGYVKNIDELEKKLITDAPKYVEMMLFKATATNALNEASKKLVEAQLKSQDTETGFLSDAEALLKYGTALSRSKVLLGITDEAYFKDLAQARMKFKNEGVKTLKDESKVYEDIYKKSMIKANQIAQQFSFKTGFGREDKGIMPKTKLGKKDKITSSRTIKEKPVLVDFMTDEENLRELELLDARIKEMNDKTDLDMILRIKKRAEEIRRVNEQYAKDELEVIKSNLEAQDAEFAKIDAEKMARLEAYVSVINSATDILNTISTAMADRINTQTEKELEAIDLKEKAELDAIDRLSISETEKEERKKKIELEASARRKKEERERITALRKFAIFQKGIDTAGIIANTALAVTKQLAITPLPAGAPFVGAILATGASQLARVLATPLPQYEFGTPSEGHKGGLAQVGEAGTELGIKPDGTMFLTPSKTSIMDLPSRTHILPHDITKELLGATMVNLAKANQAVTLDRYQDELIEVFERGTDKIANEIRKNKTNISIGSSFQDYVKYRQI